MTAWKICDTCGERKDPKEFISKTGKATYKSCKECKSIKGKESSIKGKANEYLVLGALLPMFPNTMMSSNEQTAHDLIVHLSKNDDIRVQVKTVSKENSITFEAGKRAGAERRQISGMKEYQYSADDTDVVIGIKAIDTGSFELFFVPSLVIDEIGQKSISANVVKFTKNDFEVITRCKDRSYVKEFIKKLNN